ncbi:histidine kinase N-terminal 7TM domain-containing diguanylate cyclase [Paenibacillus crassostreae]|uniref:GGDEF domain-containing protein n=1 Tax=Paenibacillus crassostreae TaxID=1763538 RepID=A0A167BAX9_9BACL|nr:diguanylate cyclase [Paenibacillus crassostreae]OAB71902.1 hypothetical protein PNBC_18065 [Paenibacillus crassostreae]
MAVVVWTDLIIFILLLALFIYVFATVTMTQLHKIYLAFHFTMMLWPFYQFAIKITDSPSVQLLYVKLSFIDLALLTTGWLLFTFFLTDHSRYLRKSVIILLYMPILIIAISVIINPAGIFVLPMYDGYIQRTYGPLFWVILIVLVCYISISVYLIYSALKFNNTPRIKKQVMHVLKGVVILTAMVLLDILFNVVLASDLPVIPGFTSLGILLSAVFFVIAIHRDKVLDIVTIAHQDIIDTIEQGILVLDDDEIVVEINQSLLPYIHFHIGDRSDIEALLPPEQSASTIESFLHTYRNLPLERAEIGLFYPSENRYVHIHVSPIIVNNSKVGRIITFQNMTEILQLIHDTHLQNEILQERNLALTTIQEELFHTNQKLNHMAITDSLTGCYNRHYLTEQLEQEVKENMKHQVPFTILLIDIDFFKQVNDNYGHLVGDIVICDTVEVIKKTLRHTDILARYGGEEFIVYLPNTDQIRANIIAERLKTTIANNKVVVDDIAHDVSVTISMGLLSINNSTPIESSKSNIKLSDLFESVDNALYQAKESGRNQIVSIVG